MTSMLKVCGTMEPTQRVISQLSGLSSKVNPFSFRINEKIAYNYYVTISLITRFVCLWCRCVSHYVRDQWSYHGEVEGNKYTDKGEMSSCDSTAKGCQIVSLHDARGENTSKWVSQKVGIMSKWNFLASSVPAPLSYMLTNIMTTL